MRIFLVLHPSGNLSVPGSMTWYRNFYEPLVDMGHEVYFYNLQLFCEKEKTIFRSKKYKNLLNNILPSVFIAEHKNKPFDIFLSYLTDRDIETETLKEIRKQNIVSLNFSCNNTHQFYLVKQISPLFDYNLHAEKNASGLFKKIGANPVWFQMSANPNYYKPQNLNRIYDVSFIGMNYARRAYYVSYLLENQVNIHCFGPKWQPSAITNGFRKEIKRFIWLITCMLTHDFENRLKYSAWTADYDYINHLIHKYKSQFHAPVTDQEMINLFNQSIINLGFLEVYSKDNQASSNLRQHLHLREFEVPMSGSLYCTNYSEELSEHYIPDKEVLVFRNEHELLDKVKYYLKHPVEADKIRKAGYIRALNDHTCHKRFETLFNTLKL